MINRRMKAIEYNVLKTIIKLISDRLPDIAKEYNIKNVDIPILPSYPADLTDLKKPSIIVRKVDTNQSKVGMGNVLGQYYDAESNCYSDVMGKFHDMMIQFDIVTSNNSDRLLLESMIADDIFNMISYNGGKFPLYDFTTGDNPSEIGQVQLIGDPLIDNIYNKDSSNLNYVGIIRHNFTLIQVVIPNQEYVDLSKWIKQSYRIKL
jgi:hypothetical protein